LDNGRYREALPPHALSGQLLTNPEIRPQMYEAACEIVSRICDGEFNPQEKRNPTNLGSILMFLPGSNSLFFHSIVYRRIAKPINKKIVTGLAEIQEMYDLLEERLDSRQLWIIPLHSTLNKFLLFSLKKEKRKKKLKVCCCFLCDLC